MIRQLSRWLGPTRTWLLVGSLLVTGLTSLAINTWAGETDWALPAQTLLLVAFLGGAGLIVGSRMDKSARVRLAVLIGPALGLAVLGLVLPGNLFPLMLGLALGWLIAAQFVVRERMPSEYKAAIKHLRAGDYSKAAQAVSDLIEREPDNPHHYNFRAEMYRLAGQTSRAIRDYERVIELAPDQALGYNGLAEVYLQQNQLEKARDYAQEAYQCEPDYWVAPYNLGMIEDRLGDSPAVVEHLKAVLDEGLPDSRHRLLTYLWLARAHHRLGDAEAARQALARLKGERKGLREWRVILDDDQAAALRQALAADVKLAERAINEQVTPAQLFGEAVR